MRAFYFSLGQATSQLGSSFTAFAIGWIILTGGRSPGWLATYLSFSLLLYALFSLVAGKLIDHFPRRAVLLAADAAGFLSLALLAVAEAFGKAGLPEYFGATVAVQLAATVVMVGTQSAMGDFGDGPAVSRAQAALETLRRLAMVAGPLLAGTLLNYLARWEIFAIDSLTYGISFGCTLWFLPRRSSAGHESPPARLRTFLPTVVWDKGLIALVSLVVIVNLLYAPVMLLWPLLAAAGSGPILMGVLAGSFMLGSILGGVWTATRRDLPLGLHGFFSAVLVGAGFLGLLVARVLGQGCLPIPAYILGFGFGSLGGPIMGLLHAKISDGTKGMFFGWLGLVGQIGQPAVLLVAGAVAQRWGVWPLVECLAVFSGLTACVFRILGPTEDAGRHTQRHAASWNKNEFALGESR
ncbi:MAG: MFS transporter [Elusimicrobiota bacterium]